MGRKGNPALIVLLCTMLASCVKDTPAGADRPVLGSNGKIYIVCEGNFGNGDATLFAYNPLKDSVYGDLYQSINSQPLGDVFQSMTRIGGRYFLCINNSNKVVVLDTGSLKLVSTINIPQPRYILQVNDNKAYVSTWSGNYVYVMDPQTLAVTGTITMPGKRPEGMCLLNNTAVICTWDTACNNVFKVDVSSDEVIQTIKIAGYAPQAVLVDKEQMLWVLSGNQYDGKKAAITRIDPSSGDMLCSFVFPAAANTINPVFNTTKDTLYYIEANQNGGAADNGIYRMGIHDNALPGQPFVPAAQYQYYWALGIDPASGYIYVGDPKGYIQKGSVHVYRPDGIKVAGFNVGLGPGHFYFEE